MKWEMLKKVKGQKGGTASRAKAKSKDIIDVLLKNRGLRTKREKDEFFKPKHPGELALKELKIKGSQVKKAINRIKKAIKKKERIIVYGDYDADGVCATAIMWETLHALGCDAMPYIPDRFSEGYGINAESIKKLQNSKNQRVKLIITVDNGIVANEAVEVANKLGIDVIITDHHQKGKKAPKAHSIIHTTEIGGAGLSWIFSRELLSHIQNTKYNIQSSLELAAIGTIADQLPLLGPNRSFAKHGLEVLSKTKRSGLIALFEEAGIDTFKGTTLQGRNLGTYEVNFVIAPRINAMGRMEHAIDSLRLLCTTSSGRARELAQLLGSTNLERQRIVEEVVLHAREVATKRTWSGAIVLSHESYHEGVIGLAASKLAEEFYRPAIVFSKGGDISKASARSIPGFNIIEAIRKLDHLTEGGGGHPMAAGFSIKTEKLEDFLGEFEKVSTELLTDEVLQKKLKIDLEIDFSQINQKLLDRLLEFEPAGIGNPRPVFATRKVSILDARGVGSGAKHLKLTLEEGGLVFSAIAFGKGDLLLRLSPEISVDVAYNIEENVWNGKKSIELKIKDIKLRSSK